MLYCRRRCSPQTAPIIWLLTARSPFRHHCCCGDTSVPLPATPVWSDSGRRKQTGAGRRLCPEAVLWSRARKRLGHCQAVPHQRRGDHGGKRPDRRTAYRCGHALYSHCTVTAGGTEYGKHDLSGHCLPHRR